jgi:GNAT superfamily N-acetyltransferase
LFELPTLDNHWLACMASLGGGGRTTRMIGGVVVTNPLVTGAFANFLTLRATDPDRLDMVLQLGEALLAGAGRRPAVWLSPLAGPVDRLADELRNRGWQERVRQVVLACPLPAPTFPEPPGVTVEEAGAAELPLWGETLVEAYEVHPIIGLEIQAAWGALLKAPGEGSRAHLVLARLEGQPAGTGLSWTHGGITGLYCGAVLPNFRRRGVERATLLYRLVLAAHDGSRVTLLQTEIGSPVQHLCVERLGFQAAYERSLWLPSGI